MMNSIQINHDIISIILFGISAIFQIYPMWMPEDRRLGRVVEPGNDIQKALNKIGLPPERRGRTDKFYAKWSIVTLMLGIIFQLAKYFFK